MIVRGYSLVVQIFGCESWNPGNFGYRGLFVSEFLNPTGGIRASRTHRFPIIQMLKGQEHAPKNGNDQLDKVAKSRDGAKRDKRKPDHRHQTWNRETVAAIPGNDGDSADRKGHSYRKQVKTFRNIEPSRRRGQ